MVAGMDFEVWRQRCSQGAPKGSPRQLLGSNLREKGAKMETKCHEKVVFFEVQLKAKCYRILFLRLAMLGGKPTVGVSQMAPKCLSSHCLGSRAGVMFDQEH